MLHSVVGSCVIGEWEIEWCRVGGEGEQDEGGGEVEEGVPEATAVNAERVGADAERGGEWVGKECQEHLIGLACLALRLGFNAKYSAEGSQGETSNWNAVREDRNSQ